MPKPATSTFRGPATADGEEAAAPDATGPEEAGQQHSNREVDWDRFDSEAYYARNYKSPLTIDRKIVRIVARHFARSARRLPAGPRVGIDVGSGTNLYPALTMLPFVSEVQLFERAKTNRSWLGCELRKPHESWQRFWQDMRRWRPRYRQIKEPLLHLQRNSRVLPGDVFKLPSGEFDIGTMFFVAESITSRKSEFRHATRMFVKSLKPDAPFAAAFMRNSRGYSVSGRPFPACAVREDDIRRALAPVAVGVKLSSLTTKDLSGDYFDGMIVAIGRRNPGS